MQVKDIPAGTKSVQVKWLGTASNNATMIFNHRIDADYKLPNSGFAPVKVTYLWEEGGIVKKDEHIASKPDETYTIKCDSKPTMKSIIMELAKYRLRSLMARKRTGEHNENLRYLALMSLLFCRCTDRDGRRYAHNAGTDAAQVQMGLLADQFGQKRVP